MDYGNFRNYTEYVRYFPIHLGGLQPNKDYYYWFWNDGDLLCLYDTVCFCTGRDSRLYCANVYLWCGNRCIVCSDCFIYSFLSTPKDCDQCLACWYIG